MYNFYGSGSFLFKLIYSFHMPFFMFISGMVFSFKFRELPSQTFSASREIAKSVRRLLIPFICWAIINGVIRHRDSMLSYSLKVIEDLDDSFWFLIVLFWCRGLFAVIHALCIKLFRKPPVIVLASMMIAIYVLVFVMTKLFLPGGFLGAGLLRQHFPYFAAGVFMYKYRERLSGFLDSISVNIAMIIIFVLFMFLPSETILRESSHYGEMLFKIIIRVKPLPGIFIALSLTKLIIRSDFRSLINALSFMGKKTLGIYTYHMYFSYHMPFLRMFFPPVILSFSAGIILTMITEKIPVVRSLLLGK